MFLKTHKTGSSTFANILFRYGDRRNLTFVLGPGDLKWPQRFRISSALPIHRQPNILCSHTRFNKKPMNWLFPPETSKYVTILRNPVDNFESSFNYYHLGKQFGLGIDPVVSLEKFLERPSSYYYTSGKFVVKRFSLRNPMMFDLGLSLRFFQNYTAVTDYINFLNKEFDLVMIMDYFDESLVLLKRLLGWDIDDILYAKVNERLGKEKAFNLSDRVQENIKRWNKADVLLFNYFNATFWRKVEMEGSGFYEDLSAFRERRLKLEQLCFTNYGTEMWMWGPKFAKGYSIRNDLNSSFKYVCNHLIKKENRYLDALRKKRSDELASEVEEQTKIDDLISWDEAKDLQYVPVETIHGKTRQKIIMGSAP